MAVTKSKKTTAPPAGDNGQHVQDIPHEEVKSAADQVQSQTTEVMVNQQIRMELQKFNLADQAIAEMKKVYGALVIKGADDKEGYKSVKEAWNDTRSKRTGLEKKGLEIRQGYTVITKAVKKEEDRLIELITPLEDDLYAKWKAIDDEKERIKKEKEIAEQAELMARVEEIQLLGMRFYDGFYSIGEDISMDVATLRAMPEEQYAKLKTRIQAKAAEIKQLADKLAEEKRQAAAEFQRQQDQLKKEQDELRRQQEEMDKQRQDLENQRLEANKMKAEMRTTKCRSIGLEYDSRNGTFYFDNGWSEPITVPAIDVFAMDDSKFPGWSDGIVEMIKAKKDEKAKHDEEVKREQQALDDKKKFIAATFERMGMSFSYTAQAFQWEDKNTAISITFNELLHLSEVEISDKAGAVALNIDGAKKLTKEHDDKIAEQQRQEQEAAMGDKERFSVLVKSFGDIASAVKLETFKTKKWRTTATTFVNKIIDSVNLYNSND